MKDYYEILEVSRKASKDTINKVFKMHMKATHPDLFQGDEKLKAEEKSKEYTEAYNILSDDNERAKYDAQLKESENENSSSQYQNLIEENEYLRQVINQKDEIITKLTSTQPINYNPQSNIQSNYTNKTSGYTQNNYGTGFNGFTPPQSDNPYEGLSLEELQRLKKEETKLYYKNMFKEIGIKLLFLGILLLILLISLFSSFKNLTNMFK